MKDKSAVLGTSLIVQLSRNEGQAAVPSRVIIPTQVRQLTNSASDPRRLQTVRNWLTECQQHRQRCTRRMTAGRFVHLPSRLIDVNDENKP